MKHFAGGALAVLLVAALYVSSALANPPWPSGTFVEQDGFTYPEGAWSETTSTAYDHDGIHRYTNFTAWSAQWSHTGPFDFEVGLVYTDVSGEVDIYVDGNVVDTVCTYDASATGPGTYHVEDVGPYTVTGAGSHTVAIVQSGSCGGSAFTLLDYLVYTEEEATPTPTPTPTASPVPWLAVCAPDCDSNDVVTGLGLLSAQLQGLSTYLALASGFITFALFVSAIFAFVSYRNGRG